MSNFDPNSQPQQIPPTGEPDWRTRRHGTGRWVPGLILIGLGIVFLLNNLTGFELDNWWALFILILAFGSLARAWDLYQSGHGMDRHVRGALFGGALMICIAVVFLFDLSWMLFGPVLLILLGGALLASAMLP